MFEIDPRAARMSLMTVEPPSPARRRRARRGDGALLRERLIDATEALWLDRGDERELTIRDVAAAAGVTSPSVYLHFADKDALLAAVSLRAWDALAAVMQAAAAEVQDPFQALRRLGAAYIQWGLDHSLQYQLLLMGPPRENAAMGSQSVAAKLCLAHLTGAVGPCVEAGVMLGDPEQLTLSMWSALHGYVALRISQPELPWPEHLDALGEHVARMAGLGTALLSRVERTAFSRPPTSGRYRQVLDDAIVSLQDGDGS
jgi:AcrR family transcriptional regulator